jgi:hypothetical protein
MAFDTEGCYAECHLYPMSFVLSVSNKPFILSVIKLNVVMLSVVILNVVAHFWQSGPFQSTVYNKEMI